nr:MAG TPA: hypothetical protein [Caudoviricetes sp.]
MVGQLGLPPRWVLTTRRGIFIWLSSSTSM